MRASALCTPEDTRPKEQEFTRLPSVRLVVCRTVNPESTRNVRSSTAELLSGASGVALPPPGTIGSCLVPVASGEPGEAPLPVWPRAGQRPGNIKADV